MNISILRRNAAGNAIASVGNQCDVIIRGSSSPLQFDCVKFSGRRVIPKGHQIVSIALARGSIIVSSIIIVTCKAGGHHSVVKSISGVGDSRVSLVRNKHFRGSLRKLTSNMRIIGSNVPNDAPRVGVHNVNSVTSKDSPL